MSAETRHVAVDLGASNGRVAVGTLREGELEIEVAHRFRTGPIPLPTGLYVDALGIWRHISEGLEEVAAHGAATTVGVDSWAADFALLSEHDRLLDGVHHYRDARTEGMYERVAETIPKRELYKRTGLQYQPFNTIFQLEAIRRTAPELLDAAHTMLLVPDLFHFWLTGVKRCERTNASTTQLYDPRDQTWNASIFEALGLPTHFLPELIEPGTPLGPLRDAVIDETGLDGTRVIAPGTHDTASAVAAVPAVEGDDWAYISSGTWSLVGVETDAPAITDQGFRANLTNEGGVHGTTRLLKNVMGLWLLQQSRRAWGEPDLGRLLADARGAPAFRSVIDPDDMRFFAPGDDMPERIAAFCRETGQPAPDDPPAFTRCILESLALKYAYALDILRDVSGLDPATVHIVGGGSQNRLLSQWTADATGAQVITGPVEATVIGNVLIQAEATGAIDPAERRAIVRRSSQLETYQPEDPGAWAEQLARFRNDILSTHEEDDHA